MKHEHKEKKDYKVEQKPTLWEVTLEHGCYSDKTEKHLFFSANDENEVWNFLCRYIEDVQEKNKDFHFCDVSFYKGCISVCGLIWGDKKFQVSTCTEKDTDSKAFEEEYGGGALVEIKRLNVIYFND